MIAQRANVLSNGRGIASHDRAGECIGGALGEDIVNGVVDEENDYFEASR